MTELDKKLLALLSKLLYFRQERAVRKITKKRLDEWDYPVLDPRLHNLLEEIERYGHEK